MLKPGLHTAMMVALDLSATEDRINAMFAVGKSQIVIRNSMVTGMYDFIDHTMYKSKRSARKRHKNAKPQPNCGPRGNNPW